MNILDRYILREWFKIFTFTIAGFPLIVILIETTDNLDVHLARGLQSNEVALAYFFGLPEKIFLVIPAAVLFATVFTLGAMARHSEIVVAKASGRSFYRLLLPIVAASIFATGLGIGIGELAPPATRRQDELLLERRQFSKNRSNFVYRAEEGWSYAIRELSADDRQARDVILERQGTGAEYPTLAIQARAADYVPDAGWSLTDARLRIVASTPEIATFSFDSMKVRGFGEAPEDLLVEEKRPEEMRYAELGRYIESLERSGGDGRKLRVGQALKIAIPFTCIIIALFGAPMVMSAPRASGAIGVAMSLVTTMVFLTLVQLSRAIGSSGLLPPTLAAWIPNAAFGLAAIWLLKTVRT